MQVGAAARHSSCILCIICTVVCRYHILQRLAGAAVCCAPHASALAAVPAACAAVPPAGCLAAGELVADMALVIWHWLMRTLIPFQCITQCLLPKEEMVIRPAEQSSGLAASRLCSAC